MHDNDPAAFQAVLDCIYLPFANEHGCRRKPDVLSAQFPGVIMLAHKYKMDTLLADVESAFTVKLDDQPHWRKIAISDELKIVVGIIGAADVCQQLSLLSYCERYMVILTASRSSARWLPSCQPHDQA